MVVGGRHLPKILGQTDPGSENADFQSIFARRSAVVARKLAEKVQLKLIGSPLRAFQ